MTYLSPHLFKKKIWLTVISSRGQSKNRCKIQKTHLSKDHHYKVVIVPFFGFDRVHTLLWTLERDSSNKNSSKQISCSISTQHWIGLSTTSKRANDDVVKSVEFRQILVNNGRSNIPPRAKTKQDILNIDEAANIVIRNLPCLLVRPSRAPTYKGFCPSSTFLGR